MPHNFKNNPKPDKDVKIITPGASDPSEAPLVSADNNQQKTDTPPQDKAEKLPSLYEMITRGLNADGIKTVESIREMISQKNLLVEIMFNESATVPLDLGKYNFSARVISTDERDTLDEYAFAKDPYGLYADKDRLAIDSIISDAKAREEELTYGEAYNIFIRTFPNEVAHSRMSRALLAATITHINQKPLGTTIQERFSKIIKLPIYLINQMNAHLDLFERAIKLELSDEKSLKN